MSGVSPANAGRSVERDRPRHALLHADPAVRAVVRADHARDAVLEQEDVLRADLLADPGPLAVPLVDEDADRALGRRVAAFFERGIVGRGHTGNIGKAPGTIKARFRPDPGPIKAARRPLRGTPGSRPAPAVRACAERDART